MRYRSLPPALNAALGTERRHFTVRAGRSVPRATAVSNLFLGLVPLFFVGMFGNILIGPLFRGETSEFMLNGQPTVVSADNLEPLWLPGLLLGVFALVGLLALFRGVTGLTRRGYYFVGTPTQLMWGRGRQVQRSPWGAFDRVELRTTAAGGDVRLFRREGQTVSMLQVPEAEQVAAVCQNFVGTAPSARPAADTPGAFAQRLSGLRAAEGRPSDDKQREALERLGDLGDASEAFVASTKRRASRVLLVATATLGLPLFVAATFLIFWNSARSGESRQGIARSVDVAVSVTPSDDPQTVSDGAVVLLSGAVQPDASVVDTAVGLPLGAVAHVTVARYQWQEHSYRDRYDRLAYSYYAEWSTFNVPSESFSDPTHHNPIEWSLYSRTIYPQTLRVGRFSADPQIVDEQTLHEAPHVFPDSVARELAGRATIRAHEVYLDSTLTTPADPDAPQIGDYRLSYYSVPLGAEMTFLARKEGDSLAVGRQDEGYFAYAAVGQVPLEEVAQRLTEGEESLESNFNIAGFVLLAISMWLLFMLMARRPSWHPFPGYLFGYRFSPLLTPSLLTALVGIFLLGVGMLLFKQQYTTGAVYAGGAAIVTGGLHLLKGRFAAA